MRNEILDENFSDLESEEKPTFKNWLVYLILWLFVGNTIISGFILDIKIAISVLLLTLVTAYSFRNWKKGSRLLLVVLLLASFNVISFLPTTIMSGFYIGNIGLSFELKYVLLFILHYALNRNWTRFSSMLQLSEEEIKADYQSKVNAFKRRFETKTNKELETMASSERLTSEAKKAAQELLAERKDLK
ncbi:MAG: hypothetical protein AB8F74_17460 [Saprospiraceae bacterium]